jgi:hypothetical protein
MFSMWLRVSVAIMAENELRLVSPAGPEREGWQRE